MIKRHLLLSLLTISIVTLLSMIFASCGDDDLTTLSVSVSQLNLSSDSSYGNFTVTSNADWTINCSETWLSFSPGASKGNSGVTVSAIPNTSTDSRQATLRINTNDGEKTATVTVIQAGLNEELSVSPTNSSLLANEGSSTSITITTNVAWQITNVSDWIHLSANSGNGTTQVTLTSKSENFSDEIRSAKITISTQNKSSEVTINQEPLLAQGCRVNITNSTIMCDGFACDLSFGREARGYREGFFTTTAVQTLTERDIYNMLMQKDGFIRHFA